MTSRSLARIRVEIMMRRTQNGPERRSVTYGLPVHDHADQAGLAGVGGATVLRYRGGLGLLAHPSIHRSSAAMSWAIRRMVDSLGATEPPVTGWLTTPRQRQQLLRQVCGLTEITVAIVRVATAVRTGSEASRILHN